MSRGSFVQLLLCPGVITFRGSNVRYITLLLSFRGSDILGFLHSGVLTFRDSYVQKF